MKIESSSVSMSSQRMASSSDYTEMMSLEVRDGAKYMEAVRGLAQENDRSYVQSMKDYEKQQNEEAKKRQEQNLAKSMMEYMDRMRKSGMENRFDITQETDLQIKLLRKLLAALNGKKDLDPLEMAECKKGDLLDLRSSNYKRADIAFSMNAGSSVSVSGQGGSARALQNAITNGTNATGTTWHRITAFSGFHAEMEYTTFATTGLVKTSDGRNINFGVEVEMSRSFMEKIDVFTDETFIKTDPLIINMDSNFAGVTDQKFRFDLDGDGYKEEISFAAEGSGFLALDKNGDGKINDGSELFGTKSGDGFADLAEYDRDHNLWIDENDEIYDKLRVWVRDSEGNDRLLDLREANVGAIYLGNVDTEFSLKNDEHKTNGIIQKTGVYLKEDGGVGTVNHVDLTM